jgi:glycerol kinase
MPSVLAIDQGTSATKAVVIDDHDQIRGLSQVDVRPTYLSGGGVEHDPQQVLASVLRAGREAAAQAEVRIDVVALANQGETVLAWDPDSGRPLTNMIVWQDRRAESVCRTLAESARTIADKTGLVLDPYFSAAKQAWIRQNVTRSGVVTTSDTWLLHQLCGAYVTDASTASRSLTVDLDRLEWDAELLELFDLQSESLPSIVDCDAIVGRTSAFGRETPVGGLVVDQQAALIAQRCLRAGELKCTFGTGAFVLANTGPQPLRSSSNLTTSAAWRTAEGTAYCIDGPVYAAASAVGWLRRIGVLSEQAQLDELAAAGAGGVLSVPAFAGLAAPWWQPTATGSFAGITLSTEAGHIVRAVLDGIAAQVAELARLIAADLRRPLERIRVDGGLTHSSVLMQATADLLQAEIEVFPSAHATPLGAAALARAAVEPGLPLSEAAVVWKPQTTYEPQWTSDRAAEFRARWHAAVEQHNSERETQG